MILTETTHERYVSPSENYKMIRKISRTQKVKITDLKDEGDKLFDKRKQSKDNLVKAYEDGKLKSEKLKKIAEYYKSKMKDNKDKES